MNKYQVLVQDQYADTIEADMFEVNEAGTAALFYRNDMKELVLQLVASYPLHLVIVKQVA